MEALILFCRQTQQGKGTPYGQVNDEKGEHHGKKNDSIHFGICFLLTRNSAFSLSGSGPTAGAVG